jgi:hypothetical protein
MEAGWSPAKCIPAGGDWIEVRASGSGFVFVRQNRGDPGALESDEKGRSRWKIGEGRTHASRLLAAGVDPAEVAKRIGDKIETLMRVYAHWIPTANRNTAAKVDAIYGTKAKPKGRAKSFRAMVKNENL